MENLDNFVKSINSLVHRITKLAPNKVSKKTYHGLCPWLLKQLFLKNLASLLEICQKRQCFQKDLRTIVYGRSFWDKRYSAIVSNIIFPHWCKQRINRRKLLWIRITASSWTEGRKWVEIVLTMSWLFILFHQLLWKYFGQTLWLLLEFF